MSLKSSTHSVPVPDASRGADPTCTPRPAEEPDRPTDRAEAGSPATDTGERPCPGQGRRRPSWPGTRRGRRCPRPRQHRPVKRGRFHPWTAVRRAWHSLPLSKRLALITTATLTATLLATSLAVTSLLYTHLLGQVDDQLQSTAKSIGSQSLAQIRTGDRSPAPTTYYVEAQYLDGTTGVLVSQDTAHAYGVPQLGQLSLQSAVDSLNRDALPITTVNSNLPGRQWRVIVLPIAGAGTQEFLGVVAIGLPLTDMMETVARTRLIVGMADALAIVMGALTAVYLVHRSFRPLRQIESVAGRIATGDLSARVPVSEPPTTEVGSLQRALNTMLQQNEQAFSVQVVAQERMTRFVSDASHELRTPLAAIRGYGELYRMGGVPPERVSEVMGRIEDESARMGRLVDDLLQLARMDEGRKFSIGPVDLTEVCRSSLADMAVLAPDRDCALLALPTTSPQADGGVEGGTDSGTDSGAGSGADSGGRIHAHSDRDGDGDGDGDPQPVVVLGDKDRLSQVVTNLLGNVTRHTPAGSPVEIAVGIQDAPAQWAASATSVSASAQAAAGPLSSCAPTSPSGSSSTCRIAVVEVRDHGPGVPEEEAEKVFRRFYRSDSSRNRETGGSGLGLSIVWAIIARHGGTVRMLTTPGGGATVRIELPLAQDTRPVVSSATAV